MTNKNLIAPIIVTFLIFSFTPVTIGVNSTCNKTIYVDDDGGADYTRIQDAIDNASDGDTIFVYSGTYYENVNINKSINLVGENRNTTIIDGNYTGKIIIVHNRDKIHIDEFTIQKSSEYGIRFYSDNNIISNSIFLNNNIGAYLWGHDNTIENCKFTNNSKGVKCFSHRNRVNRNTITNNNLGVLLSACENNIISYNNISDNINGVLFDGVNMGNIISYNIINSNEESGIEFCIQNEVLKNNISSNGRYGISFIEVYWGEKCENNKIKENIISYNGWDGIKIKNSFKRLHDSNIISGNKISSNNGRGIYLEYSGKHTISWNTISNNEYGIYIYDLRIVGIQGRNNISDNNICFNDNGIYLEDTFFNKIMRNNFLLNTKQAFFCFSFQNKWDKNYWGESVFLPYVIIGELMEWYLDWGSIISIPWFNFDWNPAKEPYDIPMGMGI